MSNTKKRSVSTKSIFAALVVATAITAVSVPASASSGFSDDTVSLVEYSNGHLLLQLSASTTINYSAYLTGGATCTQPIDTIKAFQTLTQAALLSGRQVRIYWDDCGTTTKFISTVDLKK